MRTALNFLALVGLAVLAGCTASNQPKFDELHPVTGRIWQGDKAVSGGSIVFTSDPPKPEFMTNSEVKADGTFKLTTFRTTDSHGERRNGAPAGNYTVTYTPSAGDQTAGFSPPVTLPSPVIVEAKTNDLKLNLPRR